MTQFITKNGRKIPITNTTRRVPIEETEEEQDKPQDLTSILKKKAKQEH